jgi:uncharacterized SAM-binding protein YcdF (DUF218 family)
MSEGDMVGLSKNPQKPRWSCLILGFLGIPLGILIIYGMLVGFGAILIVGDPYAPVDAIVVLSGDTGNRLATAAEMKKAGFANALVITDTGSETNNRLVREAQDAGFSPGSIYITDLPVDSTVEEAIAVREFALDRGWDSLMIVTDSFHSFRTRFIFRQELRDSGIEVLVRPVVGHWFTSTGWFLRAEGWQFAFLEIVKLLNYLLFRR